MISYGAARSRPGWIDDGHAGRCLDRDGRCEHPDLALLERPRAPDLSEDPGTDARAPHAPPDLVTHAGCDLVGRGIGDARGMGRPHVGAAAHDDVHAGRSRDPGEGRGSATDAVLGQVDQRSSAGRLEPAQLGDGQSLAVQLQVVRVRRPVLADPAEVAIVTRSPSLSLVMRSGGRYSRQRRCS